MKEFHQNGRWTITQLPSGQWQLEELFQVEDQMGVQVLSSNLANDDLLQLKLTIDAVLGNEECLKCGTKHPINENHHPLLDKWLRSLADYDNLLKRNKQDLLLTQLDVTRKILSEVLLLVDNIRTVVDRATLTNDHYILSQEELQIIRSAAAEMLRKNEITEIFPNMTPLVEYDADKHQAIEMTEGDVTTTTVIPLLQGYMWRDKVLRVAQVKILTPKAGATSV